ncbi:hypothetical protein [Arthrobacter sp. PAMC25284]|uniref:DUF7255 family protein n=1 Tax=Arthrobacter sp. PAMC25284 TaxID=2861279 RepID=UPI001C638537|nr:hypothetical protein [Arthrobacter sp. PAMC25284]QYF91100.1 hypothetical protein KY499_07900 [Arthrobacter sp. PAMC25284]
MGKREAKLLELLGPEAKDAGSLIPRASTRLLPSNAKLEILSLFVQLGGIQSQPDFAAGPWDLLYRGKVLLELDEEQHFNRYRRTSLEPWAGRLPWAERYLRFSADFEPECLRKGGRGGYWTSPATEKMFGPPDPFRSFAGKGSPRWKQRAFYDAIRDVYALFVPGVSLARVSMYDRVGESELHEVLDGRVECSRAALVDLIESRIVS